MKKVTVLIFKMTFSLHVEKDNNTFNFTLLFKGGKNKHHSEVKGQLTKLEL